MLGAQGADLAAFDEKLRSQKPVADVVTDRFGRITDCDARILGEIIRDLGGGRTHKDATINHDVGLDQIAKPGDRMEPGFTLCRVYGAKLAVPTASSIISAFTISDD
jgi:thymidine phosphorylase